MSFFKDFIGQFNSLASEYVIRIGIAIVALLIGYIAIKILRAFSFKVMEKLKVDPTLESFLKSASVLMYYIVMFMIVLTIAGVPSTYFAGMLVGLGTAIGFGLKDEFGTVSNGIIILMTKPFKVGDEIKVGDYSGKVVDIQLFQTVIRTYDNLNVIISNANIISGGIVKLSDNKIRRQEMIIGVSYEDDMLKVKSVLTKILESNSLILQTPEPLVAMSSYEESAINFIIRFWTKQPDYEKAKFSVNEAIKISFDRENISIPYPKQDITIKTDSLASLLPAGNRS